MSDFNLRATTRQLIVDLGEPDPGVVAEKLREAIPMDARDDVLGVLLRSYVRQEMGEFRRSPVAKPDSDAPDSLQAASSKWRRVRDIFNDPYFTGDEWKRLGDLSATDCESIRQGYLERAAENEVWAFKFDRLAGELKRRRKGRVADLPRDLVEEVMS